jgi:ribonuclease HII
MTSGEQGQLFATWYMVDRPAKRASGGLILPQRPSILPEKQMSASHPGCWIAGIDEAGRGPLAGPVFAGAVIFDFQEKRPAGLQDSKQLSQEARQDLYLQIQSKALAWGIGHAEPWEIDEFNILNATRLAAERALQQASKMLWAKRGVPIGALVTDALSLPNFPAPGSPCPQRGLIKGDARSSSIAAASILAKVERDACMLQLAQLFPEYGWTENKGYPTPDHLKALKANGPCSIHRFNYKPVATALEQHPEVRRSPGFKRWIEALEGSEGPALPFLPVEEYRFLEAYYGGAFTEFVKKNTNFPLEFPSLP